MIINKTYLKQYSPLPINYNLDEVLNYVPVAEKIWVLPILGQDLYDEIQEQVDNNQLSDENGTLLTDGGVWQYLSYATCLEALPVIYAHFSEVGVTKGKSENSESLDLKDLTYIENHLRRQTEFLKDSLIKWLCERQTTFPLFDPTCVCDCGCGCSTSSCGCDANGKLNNPNKLKLLYSTLFKDTDIK